ncbi:MAG: LLM class F420-dependent oxidoreductase, partial [Chloroflexota bacterium]
MKLGVVFPQTEIGTDPLAIKDFVQAAEGLGYDYLLTYEHVLGADPADYPDGQRFTYTFRDQFHEPLV